MYIHGGAFMIATIKKWGNSQGLRFSKELLSRLNLYVDDMVNIEVVDNKIIIYKAEPEELRLSDLFEEYDGNYKPKEADWGKPKGDEKW